MMLLRSIPFLCLFLLLAMPTALANEGAGLIRSDLNGAFPKALWRDQYRSEINYLLKKLPANADSRSIQVIKRNMLISLYDTSLIKNDIEPNNGEDLLTLRLKKLMQMGLWEDAFRLYTITTEDPGENNQLAQTGLLLILLQKGLPTACLEEKVLAPRFPESAFWLQMDIICDAEISGENPLSTQFTDNSVLQALYSEPDFKLSANDIEALDKLSDLEIALLSAKKRIDYEGIQLSNKTEPRLTKTFLSDARFPSNHRESLEKLAIKQALLPESPLSDTLQNNEKSIPSLSQEQLISLISTKLRLGNKITKEETQKLASFAPENPQNYFYIQILNKINALEEEYPVLEDDYNAGLAAFTPKNVKKVNLLKSLLDKPSEFSNNPAEVYEKQISLTPDGHYVMPTGDLTDWLKKTKKHQFVGLSLLIILSNNEVDASAKNSGDIQEEKALNVLKSLSTVGLIDQAHQVAREELANLMDIN